MEGSDGLLFCGIQELPDDLSTQLRVASPKGSQAPAPWLSPPIPGNLFKQPAAAKAKSPLPFSELVVSCIQKALASVGKQQSDTLYRRPHTRARNSCTRPQTPSSSYCYPWQKARGSRGSTVIRPVLHESFPITFPPHPPLRAISFPHLLLFDLDKLILKDLDGVYRPPLGLLHASHFCLKTGERNGS